MTSLLDLMDGAAGDATVHFVDAGEQVRWSHLWRDAHRCAGWLARERPHDQTLAGLLEPTRACLVTLLGAWLAGRAFTSLPHPSRGMGVEEHHAQTAGLLELAGATLVVVPPSLVGSLPGGRELSYEDVGRSRPASGSDGGRLVQFTSGSTDRPRGVVLDMAALGANAEAMARSVAVAPSDVFFSWLPLSRDMGLVGMCLAPMAAFSPELGGAAQVLLSSPMRFMRNPLSWLRLASDVGGTITAVPNFALDLVRRRLRRAPAGLDLSAVRCVIVGSETVDAGTLRRFASAVADHGFREGSLCPAYGLAEATLAVTIVRPGSGWKAVPGLLGATDATDVAEVTDPAGGAEAVALGPPVPGMRVRAGTASAGAAPIDIKGPSVASSFLGRAGTSTADGWLRTGDLGVLHGGELFFAGRESDRLVVRGRTFDAGSLQRHLGRFTGLRPGCCAAIADDVSGYSVVFEAAAGSGRRDLRQLCLSVADAAVRWSGVSPTRVAVVERGALPKSPSGKLQASRLRALLADESVVPLVEVTTSVAGGRLRSAEPSRGAS